MVNILPRLTVYIWQHIIRSVSENLCTSILYLNRVELRKHTVHGAEPQTVSQNKST